MEELALAVRRKLGFSSEKPLNAHDFMSRIVSCNERFQLVVHDDNEADFAIARSEGADHKIHVQRNIFEGALSGSAEDYFVVVHEYSHFELGHQEIRNKTAANKVDYYQQSNSQVEIDEWDADYLARAILAPRFAVGSDAEPLAVAKSFNLPIGESIRRKNDVDALVARRDGKLVARSRKIVSLFDEARGFGRNLSSTGTIRHPSSVKLLNCYPAIKCPECRKLSVLMDDQGVQFCGDANCGWPPKLQPRK